MSGKYCQEFIDAENYAWGKPEIQRPTAIARLIKSLRKGAENRGKAWSINEAFAESLLMADCHYCGDRPNLKIFNDPNFLRNTIDRVDSSKGYVAGNCVTACLACNRAKLDSTAKQFADRCLKVALKGMGRSDTKKQ